MKKFLIITLLSTLSLATFARTKVDIVNKHGQPMFNEFDTKKEADEYVLKWVKLGNWGKATWVETDCGNSFETRVNELTTNTEYLCPVDFTVTYSDITAEYDAKKAKKDSEALTLESIKTKLNEGTKLSQDDIEAFIKIQLGL